MPGESPDHDGTVNRERATRRRVLRAAGGTLTASVTGLGGCLTSVSGGNDDRSPYEEWLPSQAALGIGEGFYAFSHLDVGTVVANRDRFAEGAYDSFADAFGEGGLLPPAERVDGLTVTFVGSDGSICQILRGPFEADVAARSLPDAGFQPSGERGEFDLYDGPRGAAAVRDSRMVLCVSGRTEAAEWVRTFVDAGRGEAERLVESDSEASRLVEELGTRLNVIGIPAPFDFDEGYDPDGLAAAGQSIRLTGDDATFELVFVFADAESVDLDAVRATTTDEGYPLTLADAREVTASASGRVATVSGVTDVERLDFTGFGFEIGPDPNRTPPAPPRMAFDFEYDEAAGTVTITMQGGDTFTGEDGATLFYGLDDGQVNEWEPPVSAGESVTLQGVESGDTVLVVWESAAGDTIPLAEYSVP